MHYDLDLEDVFQAYYDCRKNKRNTLNALYFEENLERNLMDLYYGLKNDTYQVGQSICFVISRPKYREVWASDFRDRIVHHLLYNRYYDLFENSYIFDNYACRPNKGTLKAAKRLEHFTRSASKNYTIPTYYLKADIANFFISINKNILFDILCEKIVDDFGRNLTKKLLFHDPRTDVIFKSPKDLFDKVPKHKSLLHVTNDFGLLIGNLSSQSWATTYLNELDQYVKHKLKCKYYIRYVDDIIVLDNDPQKLHQLYLNMDSFLQEKLDLHFHPQKMMINKMKTGINFVGYIIKPHCKYIRRSTLNSLNNLANNLETHEKDIRQSINSYYGILKHTNSYNKRKQIATKIGKEKFDKDFSKMIVKI